MSFENVSALKLLPLELLAIIGTKLRTRDLKHLRLTCHHLSRVFAQDILQSITINFHASNIAEELSTLHLLASGRSCATSLTKWLCIRSLSPRVPPPARRPGGNAHESSEVINEEELLAAEAEIGRLLGPALLSLKNVQSVRWFPNCAFEDRKVQAEVERFLRSSPSLRQFDMTEYIFYSDNAVDANPSGHVQVPWESLIQLNTIRLSGIGPGEQYHPNFRSLSNVIDQFRNLESIELDAFGYIEDGKNDLLNRLLHHYPASTEPLRLRHVLLGSSNPHMTSHTLTHLQNLKSLCLRGYGCNSDDRMSTLNGMWTALRNEGIKLEIIQLSEPVTEFLTYLESYSGVKMLQIHANMYIFASAELSDAAGSRLFSAITKHCQTLEDLIVYGPHHHPKNWAFSSSIAKVFSACRKLQQAGIILKGLVSRTGKLHTKVLKLIMVTFLPLLDFSTLSVQFMESHPQVINQHEGFRSFIRNFRIPYAEPMPFLIELDGEIYTPIQDSLNAFWLYTTE